MAGDWIKMRADLLTHPKVVRMASALKADRFRTIGGLLSVWCLFDVHSTDGKLSGYTVELIDQLSGFPGMAKAMSDVEWLEIGSDFVSLPRFEEHNGQSAKRRAQDASRKRRERLGSVQDLSAPEADKKRTREEKRREEEIHLLTSFVGSGAAPSAAPPTPLPAFDGTNTEALNGKAVVPIAAGFALPAEWGFDAEALGFKTDEVLREAEKFRQYWTVGKGKGKRRNVKGWRQSWSNWLGKASERRA